MDVYIIYRDEIHTNVHNIQSLTCQRFLFVDWILDPFFIINAKILIGMQVVIILNKCILSVFLPPCSNWEETLLLASRMSTQMCDLRWSSGK